MYGVRVMGLMIAYICTFSSVRAKCPSSSLAQKAIYSVLLCKGIQRWVSFTNLIMTRLIRVYDFYITKCYTLFLDMPSESVGENLAHFISFNVNAL